MLLDRAKIGKRFEENVARESHLISRKALFKRTKESVARSLTN